MIDVEKRDVDDATPVATVENGGIGHFVGDAGMFHDVPLVDSKTDSELARAYLLHAELAPTTLKSTTTEVGRFLLWCQAHGKVLAAIRVEDLLAYKTFLRDPQPAAQWISSTRWPRRDPRWRPFAGPLGEPSIRQAFRVAKALLTFGVNAGYLRRNPGVLVKNIRTSRDARVTRYLPVTSIDFIYAAIEALPGATPAASKARARDRFLLIVDCLPHYRRQIERNRRGHHGRPLHRGGWPLVARCDRQGDETAAATGITRAAGGVPAVSARVRVASRHCARRIHADGLEYPRPAAGGSDGRSGGQCNQAAAGGCGRAGRSQWRRRCGDGLARRLGALAASYHADHACEQRRGPENAAGHGRARKPVDDGDLSAQKRQGTP